MAALHVKYETFDGSNKHYGAQWLAKLEDSMKVNNVEKENWIHIFKIHLESTARSWFNCLDEKTQNDYNSLKSSFVKCFNYTVWEKQRLIRELWNLKQKEDETFHTFGSRILEKADGLSISQGELQQIALSGIHPNFAIWAYESKSQTIHEIMTLPFSYITPLEHNKNTTSAWEEELKKELKSKLQSIQTPAIQTIVPEPHPNQQLNSKPYLDHRRSYQPPSYHGCPHRHHRRSRWQLPKRAFLHVQGQTLGRSRPPQRYQFPPPQNKQNNWYTNQRKQHRRSEKQQSSNQRVHGHRQPCNKCGERFNLFSKICRDCPATGYICKRCHKSGHFSWLCFSKSPE